MQLIGEYYKERVLSLNKKDRATRELPYYDGDTKIEQDFFCWRLYAGKKYIECRSEDETKYLGVFLEGGLSEIEVPVDDGYLHEILPQLLYLKRRHDEIIEDEIDLIPSRKIREAVKNKIWSNVLDLCFQEDL